MSEYKCCMGGNQGGVDPRTKYKLSDRTIFVYDKPAGLFSFLKTWNLTTTFHIDDNTEGVIGFPKENGSGSVKLKNMKEGKLNVYIYGEFNQFIDKLKYLGVKII